jgi:NADPH-dependent curcumin reductase
MVEIYRNLPKYYSKNFTNNMTNTQVKLAARPVGNPKETDLSIEITDIPVIGEGQVLVKTKYISLDPAMRGWMNDGKSYIPPIQIGEVFRAGTAGEVIESNNPKFAIGDTVTGGWGVQEYGVSSGKDLVKVDTNIAPLTTYLATL